MTEENEDILLPEDDQQESVEEPVQEEAEEDGAQHACLRIRKWLPDRRLDKYLHHRFPDFSRSMIQKLIREQAIKINDHPVKCSYQLCPDDRVDILLPPPPTNEIPAEDIPLEILYEDDHLMVINKQANLIVHPARGNRGGTLVNGLVYYSQNLSNVNEPFRPGIVHRLDRNTTGVIVIAKTDTAHWRIAHQFEHRQTKKTYIAIVQGTMDIHSDRISLPLGRHPRQREKYAIRPDSGKEATTVYELKKQYQGYALMRLMPRTGRTHQLRVHMSAIKHPIVADTMYGGKTLTLEQLLQNHPASANMETLANELQLTPTDPLIDRQALHAYELILHHPHTGKEVTFHAPLPDDMQRLIDLLDRFRQIS